MTTKDTKINLPEVNSDPSPSDALPTISDLEAAITNALSIATTILKNAPNVRPDNVVLAEGKLRGALIRLNQKD